MDVRPDDAIQAYLKTGEHDPMFFAWPGNGVLDKARLGTENLRWPLRVLELALPGDAERRARQPARQHTARQVL